MPRDVAERVGSDAFDERAVTRVTPLKPSPYLGNGQATPLCRGGDRGGSVKQFFLEGEINGVPGVVRWYVVGPAQRTLLWFDEELVQEMLRSDVATEMFSRLEVKEAHGPPPSVGAEPPAYGATLRGGVVVAGYLVKRKTP